MTLIGIVRRQRRGVWCLGSINATGVMARRLLKGQWLAINYKNRICFAQWEDCGPFVTDDWGYVFGGDRPKNQAHRGSGISLSPAIRDYLRLKSGDTVDWKFVSASSVSASDVRKSPWTVQTKRDISRRGGVIRMKGKQAHLLR
jgi:hypothetical protein